MHDIHSRNRHKTTNIADFLRAGGSPYLSLLAEKHGLSGTVRAANLQQLRDETEAAVRGLETADEVMRALRQLKSRYVWLLSCADIQGDCNDLAVMEALSHLADTCVCAALGFLVRQAERSGIFKKGGAAPETCGLCVVALGKWGAYELNYSSDIDLMVLFDAARSPLKNPDEAQSFYTRLTRDLARLLDQPTADGYVFRTDLRLRPDPGAMPLAVSLEAAEFYYGSLGQNWERAAMIKARAVAGDLRIGKDLAAVFERWIWRKSLDFAAIQDIHSIKRQIDAKQRKKGKRADWHGFDVKLGHGGIREIEFFAQTQQLIYGGRNAALRTPQTLAALTALCNHGHITADVCCQMQDAYLYLRHIEHRLQMQNDLQTHSLPVNPDSFSEFAVFTGYNNAQDLATDLRIHTDRVKKNYTALFSESAPLGEQGNLVFTGVEDDPETLVTLREMGFRKPSTVTAAVRGWHHGRYRAVRSERARQILTELVPAILKSLAATPDPDAAFVRFDGFLSRLPAGVPLFSMFQHNSAQLELVAEIMGAAPALAEYLGQHPQVLDGVLSRDFFGILPTLSSLKDELALYLKGAQTYEDVLDITRRWAREKRFHAGIHILQNLSSGQLTGAYLADIAEAVLYHLVPAVERDFGRQHGGFKDGGIVLLGMGSFAARRMYADSDLDLIGLYEPPSAPVSSGVKPLPAATYYIRLMQRIVTALTTMTSEGTLYEADTRLRPHSFDGPLAVEINSFIAYEKTEAWVWEHMCLIRARCVYGDTKTRQSIEAQIADIIRAVRDRQKLLADMREMRARIEKQFPSKDKWNLKYVQGGIVDIMFIAHALILQNAGQAPDIIKAPIGEALRSLHANRFLSKSDFAVLSKTLAMAEAVQRFLRLAAALPFEPEQSSSEMKRRLVAHVLPDVRQPSFTVFEKDLAQSLTASREIYQRVLMNP